MRHLSIFRKGLICFFLFFSVSNSVKAQTTLVAGDIAFSGYISSAVGTDAFSFVLLTNITANTVINFTDNGWLNTNVFRSGEQTVTWTASVPLNAGSEITISGPSAGAATATLSGGGATGTCTGTMPSLSTSGDQVLAYQGTVVSPTFISAIHMNVYAVSLGDPTNTDAATWDNTNSNTSNGSALPTGLATGTNAIWIGTFNVGTTEEDNGRFVCGPDVSTAVLARAALNNPANWITEDGGPAIVLPPGCNFIGIFSAAPTINTNPANSTICEGANTSFSITSTGATSHQWQVDNGGGFANITNNATYSGATTTTLNITAAPASFNGYFYRCVATNGSGSTNSTSGTLTVTALPVNPTLLAKTPATATVADGTPVSATFNAGSGGSGGCTDDYRYTTNGGASYLPYTPGSNISTTGLAAGSGTVTIEGRRAGCVSCSNSYIALATWIVTPLPAGATTLNAGDIAFSGYISNPATDEFSFVLLRNIGPGTAINFTDNGWLSTNVFAVGEQTVTWTSNAAYGAGTEIKIMGTTATLASGGSAGTVTGTALSLSTSGDQVLAYRGSAASPTFISAIHMNVFTIAGGDAVNTTAAAWDGTATGSTASALPTGLTTGVNCIWIGTQGVAASEFENSRYGTCSGPGTLGPISTLRAALNNQANWFSTNGAPGFTLPTGCSYLGLGTPPNITGDPANASICELANTSFTVTVGGATAYQWQVDNGGGFANVSNGAPYSGATTTTLTITAAPLSLNGYLYRCVTSNGSGSSTSNSATLTVGALPVGPTLLTKTPAGNTVADGTPVSATFNPGSGGTGCSDDFRYTVDGGVTYLPYTPGSNISTTGLAAGSGHVFIEGRRANCSAGCQGVYTVLALWRVTPLPGAPTTLNAGDIAFSGYTSTTAGDDFSFVLLKNIGAGTAINFTNNGWLSTNVFRTGEETVTWTAPAGGLFAGTEITISALTASRSGGGAAGTVTGTQLNLSTSGDQILAYRGTAASPTFISAIHMNVYDVAGGDPVTTTAAAWDGTANTTSSSALPTGLTTGVNCIWIGTQAVSASEFDNSRYGNCAGPGVLGPLTGLRAALNNQANWISTNGAPPGFTLPTGCNYLAVLCPTITVTNPVNTNGTVNVAFSETFTSTGGTPVVTYSTTSTLPTGLTLSSAGILSGTPTQSGTFPIVVVATDGSGCTGTGTTYSLVIACQTITVTNPVNATGTAGTAFSETFTETGSIGGATFTTASTLPSGLALSTAGVLSGTPTETGTFPITVTVIDGNGCTGTSAIYSLVISCPAPITGTATPSSQSTCSGATITAIVLGGAPAGAVYNWTRDNTGTVTGIAASGSGNISGALTNLTAAPVTVTFTITPTYYGTCTGAPYTATVIVNPNPPAFVLGGGGTFCSGSTTLTGPVDPNYTYTWQRSLTGIASPNSFTTFGGTNSTQDVTSSGNYRLIVTNQFGCSASDTTPVSMADFVFNGSLATGDAQQTGRLNRFAVLSTCAAPKSCPLTFATTGARFYDSYNITNIRNVPVCATIGLRSDCGTSLFNVAYLGSYNPTSLCTNYLADPGSSFPGTGYMEVTIPANATIVVVVHEVNPGTGCSGYQLTVDVPRETGITANPSTPICSATPVTLTAPVADSYSWNPGGNTTQAIVVSPAVTTEYFVTLGYGNNGCTGLDSATVVVNQLPTTADAGLDAAVCALTYTLAGNTPTVGTGTWTQVAGPGTSTFTNANLATSDVTVTANGIYTFRWTIATGAPCPNSSQDDVIVNFAGTPSVADAGIDKTACLSPGRATMTAAVPTVGTGTWSQVSGPVTANIISPNAPNTIITGLNTLGSYTFRWTVSNSPCPASFDDVVVVVNSNPSSFTITGGGTFCPEGTTLAGPVDPNYTYQWGKSYLTTPFAGVGTAQTLAVTSSGIYELVVTNQFGCTTSATTVVNAADYVFNGSLATGDAVQTGRLNRFAVISTCAAPKTCPGTFTTTGSRLYDSYTITNPRSVPVCAVIGLNSGCGTAVFSAAYLGSYDPNAQCTNYLADPGSSPSASIFYEATIPANGTIVVVVHEVNPGTGCANYSLTVDVPRDLAPIIANPPSVVCNGTSTLTAPVAGSYLWSPGGQTTRSIVTPPLFVPTQFNVTLGYGNNGCTREDSVLVGVTSLPPTVACPANITLSNTAGQCGRVVTYTPTITGLPAPTVTYTFTGATTASGSGDGSGSFFNIGTTTVDLTVTNACGTATCSFTVTINDTENPTITCPAPVNVECPGDVPTPNTGAVIASDNCPGYVVTFRGDVISAQTCLSRYTITRTYRVTDASNNFVECTQTIVVNDQTAPVITCPAPVTVSCAADVPTPNILGVIATDNCGSLGGPVTITWQGDVISAQTCANRYTITRTYRATDECGNFAECTQIITVDDQTPPTLTCPAPLTVSCAADVPAPDIASVTGVSDNCAGVVTVTHISDVISAQTCANRYTITRTYRATDVCGNFTECTQIITVDDQTAPVITCPAPVTVSCASAVPAPNTASVIATDNCAGVVTVTHQGDVISAQTCANRYTITRTYRATDVCGNFAECTQIITVNDQTPPVVTCPAPVTVSCASAVPAPNTTLVTATDNCAGVITITHISDVISAQTCANRYTITRTYRATDVCGNFAECTQIITVNDQTPPVVTCPAPVTVSCASAVPAPNTALVTATDNCAGVITITHISDVISAQTCANRYTITRTYRATDVCGNFAECTQIITVNDQTPPVVTCPAPLTVACASAVPAPNTALVTATDNCAGVITITHIGDVITNQTCPNKYTLTRTYRATDVCGNFAECTQVITVNDNIAPVITCPANITVTTPFGSCTAVVNFAATATDNCNGAITFTYSQAPGSVFPIGVTTVTATATDACGNSSSCTFTVTVLDAQLPTITAQPVNRTVCVGQNATFSVTAVTAPSAGGPIAYQWQQWNGTAWVNIAGATASTFTVSNATFSMNTNTFRVVLTGLCTVINSNQATLSVNPVPTIALNASPLAALLPNQTTTISATVNPAGGSFAWSFNGSPITGVTGPSYGPININGIGTYSAVYTDLNGCVSAVATIAIGAQPSNNLWVYPNPNTGTFNVRFFNQTGETAILKVFNALGQVVYTQSLALGVAYSNINVNLGNVPAGVYIVKIMNGTGAELAAKRIVVNHP